MRPSKVGSYRRGPWLALPDGPDHYEITCDALPGWRERVPAESALECLRLLADRYRAQVSAW